MDPVTLQAQANYEIANDNPLDNKALFQTNALLNAYEKAYMFGGWFGFVKDHKNHSSDVLDVNGNLVFLPSTFNPSNSIESQVLGLNADTIDYYHANTPLNETFKSKVTNNKDLISLLNYLFENTDLSNPTGGVNITNGLGINILNGTELTIPVWYLGGSLAADIAYLNTPYGISFTDSNNTNISVNATSLFQFIKSGKTYNVNTVLVNDIQYLSFVDPLINNGNAVTLKSLFDKENALGNPIGVGNWVLRSDASGNRTWIDVKDQVQSNWNTTDIADKSFIIGKPIIPVAQIAVDWDSTNNSLATILNKPSLAEVAISGDYNDLDNLPTIPAAQVQVDWLVDDISDIRYIKHKPIIQNIVYVKNETELITAITEWAGKGVIIYVTASISITAPRTWDLNGITIYGQGYLWELNSNLITIVSRYMKIYDVTYRGNTNRYGTESTLAPLTLFKFTNTTNAGSDLTFENCSYFNCMGLLDPNDVNNTIPNIDATEWGGTFGLTMKNCLFYGAALNNTQFIIKQGNSILTSNIKITCPSFRNDTGATSFILLTGNAANTSNTITSDGSAYVRTTGWIITNTQSTVGPFAIDATIIKDIPLPTDWLLISDSASTFPSVRRIKLDSIKGLSRLRKELAWSGILILDGDSTTGYSDYDLTLVGDSELQTINDTLDTIFTVWVNPAAFILTLPEGWLKNGLMIPNAINVITFKYFKDPNGVSNKVINIAPYTTSGNLPDGQGGEVSAAVLVNTDGLVEGSVNKYFANSRVLSTPLSQFAIVEPNRLSSTDTVIGAFNKIDSFLQYLNPFVGCTSESTGNKGLVPIPLTTDLNKFLCADGTWKTVVTTNTLETILNGFTITDIPNTTILGTDSILSAFEKLQVQVNNKQVSGDYQIAGNYQPAGNYILTNDSRLTDARTPLSHTHDYTSSISVNSTSYVVSNNIITLPNYPTTLPASDVSSWAKAPTKPSYVESELLLTGFVTPAAIIYAGLINSDNGLTAFQKLDSYINYLNTNKLSKTLTQNKLWIGDSTNVASEVDTITEWVVGASQPGQKEYKGLVTEMVTSDSSIIQLPVIVHKPITLTSITTIQLLSTLITGSYYVIESISLIGRGVTASQYPIISIGCNGSSYNDIVASQTLTTIANGIITITLTANASKALIQANSLMYLNITQPLIGAGAFEIIIKGYLSKL